MVADFTARAEPTPATRSPPYPPHGFLLPWNEHVAAPGRPQFTNWHMKINGSLYYVGGDGRETCVACQCVGIIHSSTREFSKPMLGQTFTSIYVPDLHWLHTSKTMTLENYGGYIQATRQGTGSRAWLHFESFCPWMSNKKPLQAFTIWWPLREVYGLCPSPCGHVLSRKGLSMHL